MKQLLTEKFEKGKFISITGAIHWVNKYGEHHRDGDKPAIIYSNGTKCWYKNGQIHRDGDKPAIIRSNGNKLWYQNGKVIKMEIL